MFQRFANTLFGDDGDELSQRSRQEDTEEEEDEDWILVNYLEEKESLKGRQVHLLARLTSLTQHTSDQNPKLLLAQPVMAPSPKAAEACSGHCGDSLSGSTVSPHEDNEEEEEEEEDLVMIPSPIASPGIRCPSCTSLNSTADTDPDRGTEDDDDVDDEEGGFLRLDACSLEESWFVTPPPCFTGYDSQPVLLKTSPLENLLIEHPSMSVYAHHSPPRLALDPIPHHTLDGELDFLSSNTSANQTVASGKEKTRPTLEGPRHRSEVAVVQRRSSLHSTCYAAALSTHPGLLQQRPGNITQRTQLLSRKALRRLNLLRPVKTGTLHLHLHQPTQRHLNF